MSKVTSESAFEDSITQHVLDHGWGQGSPVTYNRKLGLDPGELAAFLEQSQPDEWDQLVQRLVGVEAATDRVAAHIAGQIDLRGTVDVLRGHVKMNGVTFRVAFFAPANGLTQSLWDR